MHELNRSRDFFSFLPYTELERWFASVIKMLVYNFSFFFFFLFKTKSDWTIIVTIFVVVIFVTLTLHAVGSVNL